MPELTDCDLLAMATSFEVFHDPATKRAVRVEKRRGQWVVLNEEKFLLSQDGIWEYEPLLTNDLDFAVRTRWDDLRTAIAAGLQMIETLAATGDD